MQAPRALQNKTLKDRNTYDTASSRKTGLPPEKSIMIVQEALKAIVTGIELFMAMVFRMKTNEL